MTRDDTGHCPGDVSILMSGRRRAGVGISARGRCDGSRTARLWDCACRLPPDLPGSGRDPRTSSLPLGPFSDPQEMDVFQHTPPIHHTPTHRLPARYWPVAASFSSGSRTGITPPYHHGSTGSAPQVTPGPLFPRNGTSISGTISGSLSIHAGLDSIRILPRVRGTLYPPGSFISGLVSVFRVSMQASCWHAHCSSVSVSILILYIYN